MKYSNSDCILVILFGKNRFAKEYLECGTTIAPNLLAGNLMKDWEFEI
jgi:hypothetical protein